VPEEIWIVFLKIMSDLEELRQLLYSKTGQIREKIARFKRYSSFSLKQQFFSLKQGFSF